MYNKKSLGVIAVFVGINVAVLAIALNPTRDRSKNYGSGGAKSVDKSSFSNVLYYKSEERKPILELKAKQLDSVANSHMNFDQPEGRIYSENGLVRYKSNDGKYNQAKSTLDLSGEVEVKDSQITYHSDVLHFNGEKEVLNAKGNIKSKILDLKTKDTLSVTAKTLNSNLEQKIVTFEGDVKGLVKRKRRYEGKLDFAAEEVVVNSLESLVKLSKSVKINRNNYYLSAENAEIFLENFNKKLKYYSLYDDVKLVEQVKLNSGKKQTRRAYAEKLEAHQRSGKVILTGAPRVEQGNDIIKGYQITLRENVELVEVDDSQSSFSLKKDKQ